MTQDSHALDPAEIEAFYQVAAARRDIRNGFLPEPVDDDMLTRVLAARAEGLGVGWVSFFDERELAGALGLPEQVAVVAYLCVGHVAKFPPAPELVMSGWARQRPLAW